MFTANIYSENFAHCASDLLFLSEDELRDIVEQVSQRESIRAHFTRHLPQCLANGIFAKCRVETLHEALISSVEAFLQRPCIIRTVDLNHF